MLLVVCVCKLFTSVLNARLLKVYENNNVLTAQFGFRSGVSTVDAIFALNAIIIKTLSLKKLYCCFVDFRNSLEIGIRRKMFQNAKSQYNCLKSCITINRLCSDIFLCILGDCQGENLSPILFSSFKL